MQQKQINLLKIALKEGIKQVCKPISTGIAGLLFCMCAQAGEFRSVSAVKAIGFDAPSLEAAKSLIYSKDYPLEVIVNLGEWLKLRDQQGSLVWLESKNLSNKRTVLVIEKTDITATENMATGLLASVEKGLSLELLSPTVKNGLVKVKHRDGVVGFIQAEKLWGVH